ncbi:MAG: hypothetical protein OXC68_04300 [Aestuariivita sp.]|nr:hypothetical protein [Aestuariivita sp.]
MQYLLNFKDHYDAIIDQQAKQRRKQAIANAGIGLVDSKGKAL